MFAQRDMLVAAMLLGSAVRTAAHGYLTTPVSRNAVGKVANGYCSWSGQIPCFGDYMSLGGIDGPDSTGCTNKGGRGDVTGSNHGSLGFGNTKILTQYSPGSIIDVGLHITAYHGGKFEFRLQDVGASVDPDGSLWASLQPLAVHSFSPACDGCVIEPCAPSGGNAGTCAQIPLTKGDHNGHYTVRVQLPAELECDHCVLQWQWTTSNSCDGGLACPSSERFWNCADVKIVGDSGSDGHDASSTSTTPAVSQTTSTASDNGDNEGGDASCVLNSDCSTNAWCKDGSYAAWCPLHTADSCPTPQCKVGGSASTIAPAEVVSEQDPEHESPASPTSTTTGAPHTTTSTSSDNGDNAGGDASCVQNSDCSTNSWCDDHSYVAWCSLHAVDSCPTPQCKVGGSASTISPTTAAAELQPEPEPEPEPTSNLGSQNACDDGTASSCKSRCSQACGHAVATNQCWGEPRYIECTCSDGAVHQFNGCACKNSVCGSSPAFVQEAHQNHRKKVRRHSFLAYDHAMLHVQMVTKRLAHGVGEPDIPVGIGADEL